MMKSRTAALTFLVLCLLLAVSSASAFKVWTGYVTADSSSDSAIEGKKFSDVLMEGETQTYTLNGRNYEVTLASVNEEDSGAAIAQFVVRGERTDELRSGESDRMSDGSEIRLVEFSGRQAEFVFEVGQTKEGDNEPDGSYEEHCEDGECSGFNNNWEEIDFDVSAILNEGQTETYGASGFEYQITLVYLNDSRAKFSINGKLTSVLSVGGVYEHFDGAKLQLTRIDDNEAMFSLKGSSEEDSSKENLDEVQDEKELPDFVVAVGDKAPVSDTQSAVNLMSGLKERGFDGLQEDDSSLAGAARLFSEVNPNNLGEGIVVAINGERAYIVMGDQTLKSYNEFVMDIEDVLENEGIGAEVMKVSELKSSDLGDLFRRDISARAIPEPDKPHEDVICPEEARQCPNGAWVTRVPPNCDFERCPSMEDDYMDEGDFPDDDDRMRDMRRDEEMREHDRYPETSPQMEHEEDEVSCTGCEKEDKCIPYGTRMEVDGSSVYCSVEDGFARQKEKGASCQNSYECETNECSSGQCVDIQEQLREQSNLLQRIVGWLGGIF